MSVTTNYTLNGAARKVDLYVMGAFDFTSSAVQKTAPTLSIETGGQVCTGMVKLAQKVVSLLLSYDVFFDSTWGTRLTPFILAGSLNQVQRTLDRTLSIVIENTVSQIRNVEDTSMPDSYREGDYVTCYIDLKGKSFDKRDGSGEAVINTLKCWNIEKDGKTYKELK